MTSMIITGNSTSSGPAPSSESFSLSGCYKTLLLIGVAKVLPLTGGYYACIVRNDTGFTCAPVADCDRSQPFSDTIVARYAQSEPAAPLADGSGSRVTLDATMLGTALSVGSMFDRLMLTGEANAPMVSPAADAGGDAGADNATGQAADTLTHMNLVGASTHTIILDGTAIGGITLHFPSGSLDLAGLQSLPHELFN